MKKITLISILTSVFILASCWNSNIPNENTYNSTNEVINKNAKTIKKFEDAKIDNTDKYEATQVQDEILTLSWETATNTSFTTSWQTLSWQIK